MAVGRIVAGIFILSIFAIVKISSLGPCEPDCNGMKDFDEVVDPKNCSQYYTCLGQKPVGPTPCPNGTKFDVDAHECITGFDCTDQCGSGSGTCKLTCSSEAEMINDPIDCNIYYECGPAGPGPEQHCPDSFSYYDSSINLCVEDQSVCCDPGCDPVCNQTKVLIPDPYNCTKYYICQDTGPASEDLHFKCDNSESFNIGLGRCSTGAKCQTWCTRSTTVAPGPTTDCLEDLMCDAIGNFPKCRSCQPQYFSCNAIGQPGTLKACSDGYVFNTDPTYAVCVLAASCPYHP